MIRKKEEYICDICKKITNVLSMHQDFKIPFEKKITLCDLGYDVITIYFRKKDICNICMEKILDKIIELMV